MLPHGINQGGLGDCWFLAAAAAIAEYPERIQKIFWNDEYPASGFFQLTFYHIGQPVNVVVDDILAMNSDNENVPANAKMSNHGAWWGPILEKAYAKFNAFYSNMNGGSTMQAFRDLTGMPTWRQYTAELSNSDLFDLIEEADQKGWLLTSSCHQKVDGLQDGHAYTVLGAVTLTDHRGTSYDLLKMRNPWGSEGYNGAWSDADT